MTYSSVLKDVQQPQILLFPWKL